MCTADLERRQHVVMTVLAHTLEVAIVLFLPAIKCHLQMCVFNYRSQRCVRHTLLGTS
jgi:hypothetical protein